MYLYEVLRQNTNHKISKKGMNIIRYHSFYPWHKEGAYKQFMNEEDDKTLEDVLHFNKYDLYSKADLEFTLTDEIKQYYDNLLDEFFQGELQW
jgi:inositol oxygenase